MNLAIIKKAISEFKTYSKQVSENYGGSPLYWKLDMTWCLMKYGARPMDFARFDYYKKNRFERNKYLTFGRYKSLLKKLFKGGADSIFANKAEEYKLFSNHIKRPWLSVNKNSDESEIRAFIDNNSPVIAKPNHGEQGHGVILLKTGDSLHSLKTALGNDDYILEGLVENCEELKQLNPSSLNTLRVVTLIDSKAVPHVLGAWLRVGAPGKIIDNWGGGGVGYNVDVETGIIDRMGKDKQNKPYIFHPGSNVNMLGFRIPHFSEIKKKVCEMALVMPEARYVGWDIAITPDGIDLIEMNCPPGHDMMQSFETPVYPSILKLW